MAKRKNKKRRRRRSGRGPGLLGTLFFLILMCAAVVTALTVFFKVKTVEVVGETRYDKNEIIKASNLKSGDNMFFMDKFAVTNKIFENRPYLNEIKIKRKLPDRVEIVVKESIATASIKIGSQCYLMSESGKILEEISQEEAEKYCYIVGMEAEKAEIAKNVAFTDKDKEKALYSILNTAKNSGILKDIMGLNIEKLFEISLKYTDRFTVQLGTVEEIEKKLGFLQTVIDSLGSADKGVIDLTDPRTARFRPQ